MERLMMQARHHQEGQRRADPSQLTHHGMNEYMLPRCLSAILLLLGLSSCERDDFEERFAVPVGPRVQYDPLHRPFPLVPFPSDVGTRFDPHSPTGRRLNVSTIDETMEGSATRRQLNQLDGFGVFSPISVSFEGQLDLSTVNHDTVALVELTPPFTQVEIDLGDGFFPLDSNMGWMMGLPPSPLPPTFFFSWENQIDHLRWASDEAYQAARSRYQRGDLNHITHYEVESNTLIIRPIRPLNPQSRYAVILGARLMGWSQSGEYGPLRSAFQGPSALSDQRALHAVFDWFKDQFNQSVTFGWTFTTGEPSLMLSSVREGLYGRGDLGDLQTTGKLLEIRDLGVKPNDVDLHWHPRILPASYLEQLSQLVGTVTGESGYSIDFPDVDYFVMGSFKSVGLRTDSRDWMVSPSPSGGYQLDGKPRFTEVPFMLSVPKSGARGEPPFPVVIYFHGTNTSRIEGIILSQELARQGIAMLSFDQVGHGPLIKNFETFDVDNPQYGSILSVIPVLIAQLLVPDRISEISGRSFSEALEVLSDIGLFQELAIVGRWEDVNGDGRQGDAEGFFDPDPGKLCSSFWQDIIDGMMVVKTLRDLNQLRVPPRQAHPSQLSEDRLLAHVLAGDFNADGILDVGGPDVQISAAGTSLGGIHTLLFGAFETEVSVTTPIVPGAGMIDILSRTGLRFIARDLFESYLGQVVVGCPSAGRDARADDIPEALYLSLGDDASRCDKGSLDASAFAQLEGDWRGSSVTLENVRTGELVEGEVNDRGGFTLHLASNEGDDLLLTLYPPLSSPSTNPVQFSITAVVNGRGYQLQTPEFRRASQVLHQVLERCDPIAFTAPYRGQQPEKYGPPVKTLVSVALGDNAVPINTGVSLATALGLLGEQAQEWMPKLEVMRDQNVLLGLPPESSLTSEEAILYDIDWTANRAGAPRDALGPLPPVSVGDGWSAVRFAHVEGKHEWIAGYRKNGFNYGLQTLRQIAAYHRCSGRVLLDEDPRCLQEQDCPLIDQLYLRQDCQFDSTE